MAALLDMIPEGAITAIPRGILAIGRGVIIVASGIVKALTSGDRQNRVIKTLQSAYDTLFHARERVVEWGRRFKRNVRASMRIMKRRVVDGFEYYGAIGLYSATKKVLAMRWNDKPIFGNETVNKFAGIVAALGGFALLTAGLLAAGAMAKVWHGQLIISAATDTAPWLIIAAKQAVLHPLIMIGVTAAKGIALPMIAATRQALKTFDFTQGVAYAYNTMLRRGRVHAREAEKKPQRRPEAQPHVQKKSQHRMRTAVKSVAVKTLFNEKAAKKVGSIMNYFITKASPAHYEGRLKTFRNRSRFNRQKGAPFSKTL